MSITVISILIISFGTVLWLFINSSRKKNLTPLCVRLILGGISLPAFLFMALSYKISAILVSEPELLETFKEEAVRVLNFIIKKVEV